MMVMKKAPKDAAVLEISHKADDMTIDIREWKCGYFQKCSRTGTPKY